MTPVKKKPQLLFAELKTKRYRVVERWSSGSSLGGWRRRTGLLHARSIVCTAAHVASGEIPENHLGFCTDGHGQSDDRGKCEDRQKAMLQEQRELAEGCQA